MAMVVALVGCASLERVGIPTQRSKAKAGLRIALDRNGWGDAMTDKEISQAIDWGYEDWEKDVERQAWADKILEKQQNQERLLSFAAKYVNGGEWVVPVEDRVASEEMPFTMTFGWHINKHPVVTPAIKLRSAKMINGKIHLDTDSIGGWSKWIDAEKQIELHGWIVRVMADGRAGSFDAARATPHPRDLHNVEAGEHGNPPWTPVERVFLMNNEGTERTNMVLVEQ
jgi:hypothetical protein